MMEDLSARQRAKIAAKVFEAELLTQTCLDGPGGFDRRGIIGPRAAVPRRAQEACSGARTLGVSKN